MDLQGKIVNFLGDSITQGIGASSPDKRFTNVIANEYKLKKANNYGISGSRIARQIFVTSEPYDKDFCMRFTEMDKDADAVVVFGGTNDYGHGEAPLGVATDRGPHTFYGACHYLFDGLLSIYSGKPILIVTPLHRCNEQNPLGDGRKPRSVASLSVYRDIILDVAAYYALPVLDLYARSGIQPSNDINRQLLVPDGLHPSDLGHAKIAHMIAHALQEIY